MNDPDGFRATLGSLGLNSDQATNQLDLLVQGQSVMLSTDGVFLATSALFVIAAGLIWLAPRATRKVDPGQSH